MIKPTTGAVPAIPCPQIMRTIVLVRSHRVGFLAYTQTHSPNGLCISQTPYHIPHYTLQQRNPNQNPINRNQIHFSLQSKCSVIKRDSRYLRARFPAPALSIPATDRTPSPAPSTTRTNSKLFRLQSLGITMTDVPDRMESASVWGCASFQRETDTKPEKPLFLALTHKIENTHNKDTLFVSCLWIFGFVPSWVRCKFSHTFSLTFSPFLAVNRLLFDLSLLLLRNLWFFLLLYIVAKTQHKSPKIMGVKN